MNDRMTHDTQAPGLVDRLRAFANWYVSCAGGNVPPEAADAAEAADLIKQQAARIKELEAEGNALIRDNARLQITLAAALSREKEATARAERLSDALHDLTSWFDGGPSSYGPWIIKAGEYGADDAVTAARAALTPAQPDDDDGGYNGD